ncbi:aerial mycelium formation protein [soil metagenome]
MDSERADDPSGDEGVLTRLTAAGYLDELEHADTARIRALRDECRAEERRLSYVRRMIQGHLDLAADERARRTGEPPEALVARVERTLTGVAWPAASLRAVGLYEPDAAADELDDVATARLPDLDDTALAGHTAELRRRERVLSDRRAVLLGNLDRLQAALVERYRDGRAGIHEVALLVDSH